MEIHSIVGNITINIDGQDIDVPKGINIIEAVKLVGKGKEVPHYCYHPKLSISGNCRMCLVEMGMPMRDRGTGEAILDENGVQKIGWMPKPTTRSTRSRRDPEQGEHPKPQPVPRPGG